jgi:hypothetical protein
LRELIMAAPSMMPASTVANCRIIIQWVNIFIRVQTAKAPDENCHPRLPKNKEATQIPRSIQNYQSNTSMTPPIYHSLASYRQLVN